MSRFIAVIVSCVQLGRKTFAKLSTVVRADLSSLIYNFRLAFLPTPQTQLCSSVGISREYEEAAWGYHLLSSSVCNLLVENLFHFVNRISFLYHVNFVAASLYCKTAYRLTPLLCWKCVATCIILSCGFSISRGRRHTEHVAKQ
jgi:hypothetical protein